MYFVIMAKRSVKERTQDEIFKCLAVLEQNDMNMTKTYQELGISRTTLYNYKRNYWDMYVLKRDEVVNEIKDVAAARTLVDTDMNKNRNRLTTTFELLMNKIDEKLNDDDMSAKDMVALANVITPFIVDKPITAGAKGDGGNEPKQPTIIQNFIENLQVNAKSNK